MYRKYLKRMLDIVAAALALLLLGIPLLIIALLVRIKLGSPVLFTQLRPGMDEKLIRMYKFRSMTNERDAYGKLLPDKERLTKFGKFLRATSLDELPELINILKGDMSFVGPRPLSVLYLPDYSPTSRRRHEVRPGLTGYAQINGRNNLEWEKRFALDVAYVDHISLLGDLKIMLMTVVKVLKRSDITLRGHMDYTLWRRIQEEGESRMDRKDIGSNFELTTAAPPEAIDEHGLVLPFLPAGDRSFTLSGRSAIAIALDDLAATRPIRTAYVPSYCCLSMLQAFIARDIRLSFYDVTAKNGDISYNINKDMPCDVFFSMSYFGICAPIADDILAHLRAKGTAIIEDITHRVMSARPASDLADYHVMSLRKWCAVPAGGCVIRREGTLSVRADEASGDVMQEMLRGMAGKRDYLAGGQVEKETFLTQFYNGDRVLSKANDRIRMDGVTAAILAQTDFDALRARRRANAAHIYARLREMPVRFLVEAPDLEAGCPLFVPVLLPTEQRNALRSYLIERQIYCPIHWPEVMGTKPGLRTEELSLICDQRYTPQDLDRMLDAIEAFFREQQ